MLEYDSNGVSEDIDTKKNWWLAWVYYLPAMVLYQGKF